MSGSTEKQLRKAGYEMVATYAGARGSGKSSKANAHADRLQRQGKTTFVEETAHADIVWAKPAKVA
jgi:adenylylsulfate kinase-like enzyme